MPAAGAGNPSAIGTSAVAMIALLTGFRHGPFQVAALLRGRRSEGSRATYQRGTMTSQCSTARPSATRKRSWNTKSAPANTPTERV